MKNLPQREVFLDIFIFYSIVLSSFLMLRMVKLGASWMSSVENRHAKAIRERGDDFHALVGRRNFPFTAEQMAAFAAAEELIGDIDVTRKDR